MKTGTKLAFGFSILVLFTLIIAIFSLNTSERMHKEFVLLRDDIMPGALATSDMEVRCMQIVHGLSHLTSHGIAEEEIITSLKLLENAGIKHFWHETHFGLQERKAALELLEKIRKFNSIGMSIIKLKKQETDGDEFELLNKEREIHLVLNGLTKQLENHKEVHMKELAAAQLSVHKAHILGIRLSFLATAFIVLLAIIIAFTTTRSIVKPLKALQEGTEIISTGNLNYKVATDAKDEIGQLSRAFDKMTGNLRKTSTSIGRFN